MNDELCKRAVENVGNPTVLVTLISRRVRQLHAGVGGLGRPLVIGPLIFFFQAEDGIRDYKVTGVQMCSSDLCRLPPLHSPVGPPQVRTVPRPPAVTGAPRSEERRVGKECRSRRSPYH